MRKGPLKEQNYLHKSSGWKETERDPRDCLGIAFVEESLGHSGPVSGWTEQPECSENSKGSISCSSR